MIPKQIHQYLLNEFADPKVDKLETSIPQAWNTTHADFQYKLWTHAAAQAFLKSEFPPSVLKAYNKCYLPSMKCDLFRYAIIYKQGGFYFDLKICPQKSFLHDFLSLNLLFATRPSNPDADPASREVCSGVLGAPPLHPVMKRALDLAVSNVLTESSTVNCWVVTSSPVLTQALSECGEENLKVLHFYRELMKMYCYNQRMPWDGPKHWHIRQKTDPIFN